MKIMKPLYRCIGVFLLIFIGCSDDLIFDETEVEIESEVEAEMAELDIQNLDIPEGFDFSTQQEVEITIIDNANYVKYDVFGYSDEKYYVGEETFENESGEIVTESVHKSGILGELLFTGVPNNGVLKQILNLPISHDKVYIRRNENLKFSSAIVSIIDQKVNYTYSNTSGKENNTTAGKMSGTVVNDYLYCVNGSAELFQVDPLTGELTYLSNMPMGSWTCAIDQENKVLYSIGRSSPYPLMKYSIEYGTWETISNIGKGGPRLEYNSQDGLLYFSTGDKLYTYNTSGVNINTWNIIGLHNTSGGDLAIDDNGNIYLCTFSGLYSLELDANNDYQSTRISADNLPFQPTSMTFDSNKELWLSNSAGSSDLIIMDTQTGGWQYNYGINANNNTDYGRTINDLTTFRVYSQIDENIDTDGDGILDRDDSYPEDSNKAFEMFTPSKYGWGTVAFEDLWPSNGDYDFNDLAVNYRIIAILNAQNLAVQLDFIISVKSNRAGFTNGFGIEIESLLPSQISSVSGNILTHNYISQNANGTESGQENAVIILFDDPNSIVNQEITISVQFNQPISTSNLGTAPFNPFLIVNKTREKEVHLAGLPTTSKGSKNIQISGVNSDKDGNYFNDNGLPWAIDIVHDFKVPKERTPVTQAYNYFAQWATSGGTQYQDWYKDNPGYRNIEKLEQ
jgi:LruC domain-containing protein